MHGYIRTCSRLKRENLWVKQKGLSFLRAQYTAAGWKHAANAPGVRDHLGTRS